MTRLELKTLVHQMTGIPFHDLDPALIRYLLRALELYASVSDGKSHSRQIIALGIATWEQMQQQAAHTNPPLS